MRTNDHAGSGSGDPHVVHVVITIRDPWNPDAPAVPFTVPPCGGCGAEPSAPHKPRCKRDQQQPCGCGYDLCGECGRIRGPKQHMTVPGVNRVRPATGTLSDQWGDR